MLTRLNHLGVTISYKQLLKVVDALSKHHEAPIKKWIDDGATFKFVGDNVDRRMVVRDVRSDNHDKLVHMFSLIAVRDRVKPPPFSPTFTMQRLLGPPTFSSLIELSDVQKVKDNLVVLVSRDLCKYIKCLSQCASSLEWHIKHTHSSEMAAKSEVAVLDVLHLNESKNSDKLEIMKEIARYVKRFCFVFTMCTVYTK